MKPAMRMVLGLVMWAWSCGYSTAAEKGSAIPQERQLWQMSVKAQQDKERHMAAVSDPEMAAFLETVNTRLWAHVKTDLAPASVQVTLDAAPDACAYPNGIIQVTTGMLAFTRSEDQLAMILAHEIIHYIQRHSRTAFELAQSKSPRGAGEAKRSLAEFCVRAERQADQEGLALMLAAGYCPREVLPMLDRFQHNRADLDVRGGDLSWKNGMFSERTALVKAFVDQLPVVDICQASNDRQAYSAQLGPALLANARIALKQGFHQQATESIARYLSFRSDDPHAYFLQGEIESRMDRHLEEALACYQKAIELDRSFAPAYRAMGVIHLKEGRLRQARDCFETSLVLAPQAEENEYIRDYLILCRE